jgi:hypothetical protein
VIIVLRRYAGFTLIIYAATSLTYQQLLVGSNFESEGQLNSRSFYPGDRIRELGDQKTCRANKKAVEEHLFINGYNGTDNFNLV